MTCPNDTDDKLSKSLLLRIVLPFPLPTWNRLLAANPWQRRAIRKWIHHAAYLCFVDDTGLPTLMVSPSKLSLIASSLPEYLQMIRPKKSLKARLLSKSKSRRTSQKKQ